MKSDLLILLFITFLITSEFVNSLKKSSSNTLIRDFRKFLRKTRYPKEINEWDYAVYDTLGLVKRHGYPGEKHTVITGDGYKLQIFRINGNPLSTKISEKKIVFLQHGVLWSSDAFVLRGPAYDLWTTLFPATFTISLDHVQFLLHGFYAYITFMLADAGYDVWMGNVRGNTYGRSHITKNRKSSKFWDFSYHEMGIEDLPCMIDYVLENTNEKSLYYVGHSMGSTIAYVMLSLRPEYNAKIKLIVSLAPVTLWRHQLNLMQTFFSQVGLSLEETLNRIDVCEILPQTTILARQADQWCNEDAVSYTACLNMIFSFVGEDREQLNATLLPYLFSYFPAGTSLRTIIHFHQNMRSGEFSFYDYKIEENLSRYQQSEPPFYPLSKITAPVALIYGKNDAIVTAEEMYELAKYLKNVTTIEAVPFGKFNHMDFIWASDVKELLNKRVLQLLA